MLALELKSKFKHLILICGFLLTFSSAFGQDIPDQMLITYNDVVGNVDTTVFGAGIFVKAKNDTLRLAFQKALSYYPELWGSKIRLKYGKSKTSMSARPRMLSVFKKRDKRSYKVIISSKEDYKPALMIKSLPFNALVGVLGHELAHILDYSDKSGWKVIEIGAKYVFSKAYRKEMEHFTDSLAMSKGLQWQVYHYSYFVVNEADLDEDYRQYKMDMYMSPEEVYDLAIRMDSLQMLSGSQK